MTRVDEYKHKILALLPPSDGVFPSELGTHPGWDELIAALARAPADVHDRALEALAEGFPSEVAETLERYESMLALPDEYSPDSPTDAQRLAAVLGRLTYYGQVDQANLQSTLRELFDDSTLELFGDRLYQAFMTGTTVDQNECGATEVGQGGAAVWFLEYMDHALQHGPDEFENWVGIDSATSAAVDDPVTGLTTADSVTAQNTPVWLIETSITGIANNAAIRVSFWVRPKFSSHNITVRILGRDGSIVATDTFYNGQLWQKVTYMIDDIGAGASDPKIVLTWAKSSTAGSSEVYMARCYVGVRDLLLEQRAAEFFQLHTSGEFRVKGESGL